MVSTIDGQWYLFLCPYTHFHEQCKKDKKKVKGAMKEEISGSLLQTFSYKDASRN